MTIPLIVLLPAPDPAPTNPDAPCVTEWAAKANGDCRRDIGSFALYVEDRGDEYRWSVEWGDDEIDSGMEAWGRTVDPPTALARAKDACEAAARRAGIAVPR